jgi:hypothetical protein
MGYRTVFVGTAVALVFAVTSAVEAAPIRPGFEGNTLAPNDDGSTGSVSLPFTENFFGVNRSSLFVNNNGNVTFDSPLSTFTPFDLTSTGQKIIAPFFADVDTRNAGDPVTYGTGTVNGRDAFGVNWINVDYFASSTSHTKRNDFQLVLVDRSDTGTGNFDIEFNYEQIEWETGDASFGTGGLGGNSARIGFSNGTGNPGTDFELAGSVVNGAFLDSGPSSTSLIQNRLNSSIDGRYVFEAREGSVHFDVPLPATLLLLLSSMLALESGRK